MQYSTTIIVTENFDLEQQKTVYQALFIPALHYQQDFNAAELAYINTYTLEQYLKYLLVDLLEECEKKGQSIDPPRTIEQVLKLFLGQAVKQEASGLQLSITVDYESLIPRSHFFEKVTPWIVSISSILEILLGTVLSFCSMEFAQGSRGLIPMNMNANIGLSATSSVIGLFWALWDFFTDGAIVSLRDTGATIDKKCQQLWAWLRGKKSSVPVAEYPATISHAARIIGRTLKSFIIISFLNNLYRDITGSYTSIMGLSNIIAENISIPANIYTILLYLQLVLDHMDDPFMWSAMIYFHFNIIDAVINVLFPAVPIGPEIEQAFLTSPDHLAKQAEQQQLRATRLSRWLSNTDASSYHLLTDNAPLLSQDTTEKKESSSSSSSSSTQAFNP